MNDKERETVLGFKPQRENIYSRYLPYANKLDDESNKQFISIKTNLCRSIQLRDLKHGASHWSSQLTKYIRIYGFKFSKEDHILLVKLLYNVVTIPKLDYSMLLKYSLVLSKLLQKSTLLSRDDLEIEWKPLYDIFMEIEYGSYINNDVISIPPSVSLKFMKLIVACRDYFPLSATKEILDIVRPYLCPRDIYMNRGLKMFELFLPSRLPPKHYDVSTGLWFNELATIWENITNSYSFESKLVNILSRVALDQCGYLDWEPYLPAIFNKFMRSLNLPIMKGVNVSGKDKIYDYYVISDWTIAMLGPKSKTQDYLDTFMKAIQSFYHPSNTGKWNSKLQFLLQKFVDEFLKRIHLERYHRSWYHEIPVESRISDDCIRRFVACFKPVVEMAMFDKTSVELAADTYRRLNCLSGDVMMPHLIEKANDAFQTSVEHHRLISLVLCLTSVCPEMIGMRSLLDNPYKQGRHQIISLLYMSLPGIDYNDPFKSYKVLRLIKSLVENIYIADYTSLLSTGKLTPDEEELCLSSNQFEDFVLLFIDRILVLVENCAQSQITQDSHSAKYPNQRELSSDEHLLEKYANECMNCLALQCSDSIYEKMYQKMSNYVFNNVPELQISGYFLSSLMYYLIKSKYVISFHDMMKKTLQSIELWLESNPNFHSEETLETSILWSLTLLPKIILCGPNSYLKPYVPAISKILTAFTPSVCKLANYCINSVAESTLDVLTTGFSSMQHPNDKRTLLQRLRDWGIQYTPENIEFTWEFSNQDDLNVATHFLKQHLPPVLDNLLAYVDTDGAAFDRDKLKHYLEYLTAILSGITGSMEALPGKEVEIVNSLVKHTKFSYIHSINQLNYITLDGKNVRLQVLEKIVYLLNYILKKHESDTRSLVKIISIFNILCMDFGIDKSNMDYQTKKYGILKKHISCTLDKKKSRSRALIYRRIILQHLFRFSCQQAKVLTQPVVDIIKCLLRISTSRYSKARKVAQKHMSNVMASYSYSYRLIIDDIVEGLKVDPTDENLRSIYQGNMYVMIGENKGSMMTRRNWSVQLKLWPAVLKLKHSSRISDQTLIDRLIEKTSDNLETFDIITTIPDNVVESASRVFASKTMYKYLDASTTAVNTRLCVNPGQDFAQSANQSEISHGLKNLQFNNDTNIANYNSLSATLCDLIEYGNLWWKFYDMAMNMISISCHHEMPPSDRVIRILMDNLIHESAYVRYCCIYEMSTMLILQKRAHKKVILDRSTLPGFTDPGNGSPGDRPDNRWLQVFEEDTKTRLYDNDISWNSAKLVDKTHIGFYCFPEEMKVYAPSSEQPELNRKPADLTPGELYILKCLTNPTYLQKFFELIIIEDGAVNRPKKFNVKNFTFYRCLFRNYGDEIFEAMKPNLLRMALDSSRDTHQVNQRCAAEVITGVLIGMKHWNRTMTKNLWEFLTPLMKQILVVITNDTISDWITSVATISASRDPKRLIDLFEVFSNNPITGESGSFIDSCRLYMLQGVLTQQQWRIPYYLHKTNNYLLQHIDYAYKNVRDRLSSLLVDIYLNDFSISSRPPFTNSPKHIDMLQNVVCKVHDLKPLVDNGSQASDVVSIASLTKEQKKSLIRTVKTILQWIQGSLYRTLNNSQLNFYDLLPTICGLSLESLDDDIKKECSHTVTYLSYSSMNIQHMDTLYTSFEMIMKSNSWRSKEVLLNFIGLMVFYNYFILRPHTVRITNIIKTLLIDNHVEIREKASQTLTGFIMCEYTNVNDNLIREFMENSRKKLINLKALKPGLTKEEIAVKNTLAAKRLRIRHAGVLGLTAIVASSPYDVTPNLPEILITLVDHVNDPQPISTSVKKILMLFKHTHMDNWQEHKQKFTADQLNILSDLLISPNYYA